MERNLEVRNPSQVEAKPTLFMSNSAHCPITFVLKLLVVRCDFRGWLDNMKNTNQSGL